MPPRAAAEVAFAAEVAPLLVAVVLLLLGGEHAATARTAATAIPNEVALDLLTGLPSYMSAMPANVKRSMLRKGHVSTNSWR
jgi:hypothetical protein